MALARDLVAALRDGRPVRVPRYDKAAHGGRGDRAPPAEWAEVNGAGRPRVQVVVVEGWCVGFRALAAAQLRRRWEAAAAAADAASTLWRYPLDALLSVNERLAEYDVLTDRFDAFIHVDAEDTAHAFAWRLEQEAALRREKGAGMTDEQVVRFVESYCPSYELYTDALRRGVVKGGDAKGRQLRLVVRKDRTVKEVIQI